MRDQADVVSVVLARIYRAEPKDKGQLELVPEEGGREKETSSRAILQNPRPHKEPSCSSIELVHPLSSTLDGEE